MNASWRAAADLDGRSVEPVTEAALQRAAQALQRVVAEHDHPMRWEIGDIADWLAGTLGAPGSAFPVRMPIGERDDVIEHLRAENVRLREELTKAVMPAANRALNKFLRREDS